MTYDKVQFIDNEALNNCIKTVGVELKWTPKTLRWLYVDNTDSEGLIFWYNEILRQVNSKS